MRDYLDRFIAEKSAKKRRKRVFDHINFSEKELSAPFSLPKWTLSGYSGRLKDVVESAIHDTETSQDTDNIQPTIQETSQDTDIIHDTEETTEETEESKFDSDALSNLSFYCSSSEE